MHPLRNTDPSKAHHIVVKTFRAEILFVPKAELNEIIGGIIARYIKKHEIVLYAVCVLGNHIHIICQAPEAALPFFAADMAREISKRVNRYLGRSGTMWRRRYDDFIIIKEVDALEGVVYTLTNPVKHGLVSHPKQWPGVSTYWQTLGQEPVSYGMVNYTEYGKAKRRAVNRGRLVRKEDYEIRTPLEIEVLPVLKDYSEEKRIEILNAAIEARTAKWCRKHRQEKKSFMGRKAIINQKIQGTFPKESANTPRPWCYSKDPDAIEQFKEEEKARRKAYKEASISFRSGDYTVVFPPFCLLPPMHYIPGIQPRAPS